MAAADDIGGVKYQRVKVTWGADGTANDANNATPLPVADGGGSLTVDGTVAASNLPATVDTNSGVKSASTLRVVLATDQPALTNKLLVTPDSVALPANQSVNAAQLAGTTTDTNSGVKSAGTLRVVLATDQPALTNKLLVTPDSVALPANQSVNQTQWNGTTVDTNSGTKSAGTVRVVLATDQPALTNKLLVTPDAVTHDVGNITTSVVPGTSATHLGKAEDGAHTSGDTGVFILGVRNDTPSSAFSGTDKDYTPIATDSAGRVYVEQKSTTGTCTNTSSSATNVTLLASNTARIAATVYNDSTQILYLKLAATASSTSFTAALASGAYYEIPGGYTGIIDGIWVSANGSARVTEIT